MILLGTNSVVINKIVDFFKRLNYYFQYSGLYKVLAAIGHAGKTSIIVTWFIQTFLTKQEKNYYEGSFILKILVGVFCFFTGLFKVVYLFLLKMNQSSFNKKLFDATIAYFRPEKISHLICTVFAGFFISYGALKFLRQGNLIMTIALFLLSIVFFLLSLVDGRILLKAVKGCLPYKLIQWFMTAE